MIEVVDELTIAFLAMGAKTALDKRGGLGEDQVDVFEGEIGFIRAVIDHAPMLDEEWRRASERFHGVFAYEIAEPFGEECAEAYLDGHRARFDSNARHLARAMVEKSSDPEERKTESTFRVYRVELYSCDVEARTKADAYDQLDHVEWNDEGLVYAMEGVLPDGKAYDDLERGIDRLFDPPGGSRAQGPTCGHSVCSQDYIDTGERECVNEKK